MTDDEMTAFIAPIAAQSAWDDLSISEQSDMCNARDLFGDEFVDSAIRSGMTESTPSEQTAIISAFFNILDSQC
jgi:hypothetical protein